RRAWPDLATSESQQRRELQAIALPHQPAREPTGNPRAVTGTDASRHSCQIVALYQSELANAADMLAMSSANDRRARAARKQLPRVALCERRRAGFARLSGWQPVGNWVVSAANFPASLLPVGATPTTSRRIATHGLRRKMARSQTEGMAV